MTTATLAEFLLARIADQEADSSTIHEMDCDLVTQGRVDPNWGWECTCGVPARVLADCEAKRQIVALHSGDHECSTFDRFGEIDNCTWVLGGDCSTMRVPRPALRRPPRLPAGVEAVITCPCPLTQPHDPHFYVSAIAGGEPGPIPQVTCVCLGRP